jgi:hypothetical protein
MHAGVLQTDRGEGDIPGFVGQVYRALLFQGIKGLLPVAGAIGNLYKILAPGGSKRGQKNQHQVISYPHSFHSLFVY